MRSISSYLLEPVGAATDALRALSRRFYARWYAPIANRERRRTAIGETKGSLLGKIPAVTYVLKVGEPPVTVYCSPQIEAMLGYPLEVFEKDPTRWITVLHPEDRERILAEVARVGSKGEPFDAVYRCVSRDGRTIWVHDKAVFTRDEEGLPRFREGVYNDHPIGGVRYD